MSETKFTAGKWAWTDHGVGELVVYETAQQKAICTLDDSDKSYAWPEGYSVSKKAKANCHLIAAAPDMDEAIDYTLDLLWSNDVTKTVGMAERSVFDKLKAAQKKARGEHETD